MKYCIKCGYKLRVGQVTCPDCGRNFSKISLEEKIVPVLVSEPIMAPNTKDDSRNIQIKKGLPYSLVLILTIALLGGGGYALKLWSDKEAEITVGDETILENISEKSKETLAEKKDKSAFQATGALLVNNDNDRQVSTSDELIIEFSEDVSSLNKSFIDEFTVNYTGEEFVFKDISPEEISISPSRTILELEISNTNLTNAKKFLNTVKENHQ